MEIKTISRSEYDDFSSGRENKSFLNSSAQAERMNRDGAQVFYLGGFENNQLCAACVCVLRQAFQFYKFAYIPRGYFLDWHNPELVKEFTKALADFLASYSVLYIHTNPYFLLQERDRDGKTVQGGINSFYVRDALVNAGFSYMKPAPGYNPRREAMYMSVLDLDGKTMEQLLKEMDQQTRWSINRAAKYNLEIREAQTDTDFDQFANVMEHTGQRNGFSTESSGFYKNLMNAYGDDALLLLAFLRPENLKSSQEKLKSEAQKLLEETERKLLETPGSKKFQKKKKVLLEDIERAEKNIEEAATLEREYGPEILLAGSLFLSTENEMVYLYSGAYDQFMKYNAPYAIHAAAIEEAVNKNKKTYNFYGISGYFEKDQEGYSLFAFKRGFGCYVVELIGDFVYPVRKGAFKLYQMLKPDHFRFEK